MVGHIFSRVGYTPATPEKLDIIKAILGLFLTAEAFYTVITSIYELKILSLFAQKMWLFYYKNNTDS